MVCGEWHTQGQWSVVGGVRACCHWSGVWCMVCGEWQWCAELLSGVSGASAKSHVRPKVGGEPESEWHRV